MNHVDVGTFGDLLISLRKQRRISQNELADKLNVHRNTIGKWERGICLPESRTLVLELAKHLRLNDLDTRQLLEASLTALSTHWLMPYQRNLFFTGREDILEQLHQALSPAHSSASHQSYALSGLGGIGKTQIAIEYAYRYANDYAAVFWISADSNESMTSSIIAIAQILNLAEKQEQDQGKIVAAVARWLTSHSDWLLIFDNVEDVGMLKDFLPAAREGSRLLTTRLQALGTLAHTIDLAKIPLDEGIQFLLRRAKILRPATSQEELPPSEASAAEALTLALDGLPLALDQAGAYIEATRCSVADYLHLFQSSQLRLLDERDTYADHPHSVTRTFTLAFEQVQRNNVLAAELLTVCAYLAPEAIPEAFFIEGAAEFGATFASQVADPFHLQTAIKVLLTYSLLQRNADTRMVTVHRLVQTVLKGRLPASAQRIWATRVTCAMSDHFPADETTNVNYWPDCDRLLPHALACLALTEQWSGDGPQHIILINRIATYLTERGRYSESQRLLLQSLQLGKQMLDPEHALIAEALKRLGSLHMRQGKYADAESYFQQALSIQELAHKKDQLPVAGTLSGLATLYMRQGKHQQAEPLFLRALAIREQLLGADHPQVATSLGGLAILYGNMERYQESEPLYLRALDIRERTLGPDHAQVATILNNLAEDYKEQGMHQKAEALFLRTLKIWERDLGPEHVRIAYPINNLADLCAQQGKYQEAEALFLRGLKIWEQGLGTEHVLLADVLEELAHLYLKQNKHPEVEPLLQRALRLRKNAFGPEHSAVADSLQYLAQLYQLQQRLQEALPLYQQELSIREQTLGPEHAKTKTAHTAYTNLLKELDLHKER